MPGSDINSRTTAFDALRQFINNPVILGYLLGLALLLGIIAGIFPAFYLSSFKPALVLKSSKLNFKGALSLRKVLVVIQFTISIVLIIGTLIVAQQVRFMQSNAMAVG